MAASTAARYRQFAERLAGRLAAVDLRMLDVDEPNPKPELWIACEGEEERLGRIEATIGTEGRTASSFLSHLNTSIHEKPDDVARASGRVAVREGAQDNDEVRAEPE